jgi:hypothetical protein
MPPAGFEPTIQASEDPKTNALNRTAAGIGMCQIEATDIAGCIFLG